MFCTNFVNVTIARLQWRDSEKKERLMKKCLNAGSNISVKIYWTDMRFAVYKRMVSITLIRFLGGDFFADTGRNLGINVETKFSHDSGAHDLLARKRTCVASVNIIIGYAMQQRDNFFWLMWFWDGHCLQIYEKTFQWVSEHEFFWSIIIFGEHSWSEWSCVRKLLSPF